ncbi:MAG: DUF3842 family protein [Oscillospiraceae bacterium]|jgi:hypothetical protein|nr:DUF3842 family protein [Oscillospiraceae bacterium]MDD3261453.1 DUF3842 family protein [Oscillospiraceae bacterium]
MNILIIDGQGGGIGRQLVTALKNALPQAAVRAVGTNSAATAAMRKAGADSTATGENAVRVACRKADVIAGPIGIVIADALCGEITPKMAKAVGQSTAVRVLIPVNHCDNLIAGIGDLSITRLVQEAVHEIEKLA